MRIRVLGGGFYGCHLAAALLEQGHSVELHEISDRLFSGASGGIPARLHLGFHYPRSYATRQACQAHRDAFAAQYGHLTRSVPVNIYAVADHDSLIDFGTYRQVLKSELEFVTIERPSEFGLENVEGALLTGERHIVTDMARVEFEEKLAGIVRLGRKREPLDSPDWDWTIDCTFCANDSAGVERYEPCVTGLLRGPADRAITIMDGPFPSLYPWDPVRGISSITSALLTPRARCATRAQAEKVLASITQAEALGVVEQMIQQMSKYYPQVTREYDIEGAKVAIRAQPRSGSDARLVEVVQVHERVLRVRAGKIDAILHAEALIWNHLWKSKPRVVSLSQRLN